MNISQLRAFVTIVERGSFSDAARELGVSQPAVTMQLQSLESEVSATLLDRRYRRVDLTDAGRTLLPHARRVLDQIAEARDEIDALSGTVSGRLVIAASTTPGVYLVPALLGSFIERYPQVGVSVTVGDTADVVRAVESGEAHLAVSGDTVKGAKAVFEEIGRDELVLIAPPEHRFVGRKKAPLSELCDEAWILREHGSGTRHVAERLLAEHGLETSELRVVVELSTGEAIVSAVEGGLGLSIVSRLVAEKALRLGTVVELDVVGLPTHRPFFAVLPKGTPSRVALAFVDHLRDNLS